MMITSLTAIFHLVLTASWQSSFVILLVLLVRPLMGPRVPARWRYLLWSLVVLRLLVPVGTFPSSSVSIQNLAVVDHPLAETAALVHQHDFPPAPELPRPTLERHEPSWGTPSSPRAWSDSRSWWPVAAMIWIVGACTIIGFMIAAQARLRWRLENENAAVGSSLLALWSKARRRLGIKGGPLCV